MEEQVQSNKVRLHSGRHSPSTNLEIEQQNMLNLRDQEIQAAAAATGLNRNSMLKGKQAE